MTLGHKQPQKLRSKLCNAKDKRETMDKNGVIYKINCNECNKDYIGETGKELRKRITERINAVRRCDISQQSTDTYEQRIAVLTGVGQQF